jgi:hypothetical protein
MEEGAWSALCSILMLVYLYELLLLIIARSRGQRHEEPFT